MANRIPGSIFSERHRSGDGIRIDSQGHSVLECEFFAINHCPRQLIASSEIREMVQIPATDFGAAGRSGSVCRPMRSAVADPGNRPGMCAVERYLGKKSLWWDNAL